MRLLTFDFCLSFNTRFDSKHMRSCLASRRSVSGGDLWHTARAPIPMAFASVLYSGWGLASQPIHLGSEMGEGLRCKRGRLRPPPQASPGGERQVDSQHHRQCPMALTTRCHSAALAGYSTPNFFMAHGQNRGALAVLLRWLIISPRWGCSIGHHWAISPPSSIGG